MKKFLLVFTLLVALGAAAWYFLRRDEVTTSYRFVEVEQGDLESTVSATGALSAVRTVEVGTQVSGQVARIYVDFNDYVKKGQLVARIDPTLLNLAVDDAQASLERSKAELARAEQDYARQTTLYERKVLTEVEFQTTEYNLALAKANLKSAETNLTRAQRNLAYADVYAPVDGVVIERNVDVGQTVAASLSAPILFLIAEDLSKMEILASVDESDIGQIGQDQTVRFTVQAYPDETFYGTVRQVRMQSTNQENVVNYTVVVNVDNPDGKLLPGMTATVNFVIQQANDVLKVANAALRFRPTEAMMAALQENSAPRTEPTGRSDSTQAVALRQGQGEARAQEFGGQGSGSGEGGAGVRQQGFGGQGFEGSAPANTARLWYLDEAGNLSVMRVRTGITDGQATAIMGPEVQPGMQIIAGVVEGAQDTGPSSPFQSQPPEGGFRRPGAF